MAWYKHHLLIFNQFHFTDYFILLLVSIMFPNNCRMEYSMSYYCNKMKLKNLKLLCCLDQKCQFLWIHQNSFLVYYRWTYDYCPHSVVTDHLSCYTTVHAVLFFAISTFFELLCVALYAFIFPKLPIVKYFRSKAASEGSKTVSADLAAGGIRTLPGKVLLVLPFFFHSN